MKTSKSRTIKVHGSTRGTGSEMRRRRDNGSWETVGTFANGGRTVFTGTQYTESENHGGPPNGADHDVGGPFYTIKKEISVPRSSRSITLEGPLPTNQIHDRARGFWNMNVSCPISLYGSSRFPPSERTSDSELEAAGATAISRCAPTSSAAELSVGLGEIYREGIPHKIGHTTWEDRTLSAKNAGSDYLNVQFGWVPLVSEVLSFGQAVKDSDSILNQYRADRGKLIRRRYRFPTEVDTKEEVLSQNQIPYGYPVWDGNVYPGTSRGGKWTRSTRTQIKRWFSGAFIYGVPGQFYTGSGISEMAAEADRLFGLSLTPDTLWNLSPWSWAADWFTNTGDVLSNISDMVSQGLVMRYGYIMEQKTIKVTYALDGVVFHDKTINVPNSVVTVESKARVGANPFGFGVSWEGLSSFQVSILAALGLSRS